MSEIVTLKPCPCCYSTNVAPYLLTEAGLGWIECRNCAETGPSVAIDRPDTRTEQWNALPRTRTPLEQMWRDFVTEFEGICYDINRPDFSRAVQRILEEDRRIYGDETQREGAP